MNVNKVNCGGAELKGWNFHMRFFSSKFVMRQTSICQNTSQNACYGRENTENKTQTNFFFFYDRRKLSENFGLCVERMWRKLRRPVYREKSVFLNRRFNYDILIKKINVNLKLTVEERSLKVLAHQFRNFHMRFSIRQNLSRITSICQKTS